MFTDAAFLRGRSPSYELIEYSFAEPPAPIGAGFGVRPSPSIHFRHEKTTANAAWVDGHVSAQVMSFTDPPGSAVRLRFGLGWFGPDGNAWFDLQ